MSKLEKAKKVVRENIKYAECGIFNTRNWTGDPMSVIYDEDGLTIEVCYHWEYFEVFGLTDEEFLELVKFYEALR